MAEIDDARRRLPIWVLFGVLGLEGADKVGEWGGSSGNVVICSPFREDRTPSFSIFERDGVGFWKDFGTNESGDEIKLIEMARGCSTKDAIALYFQLAGIDPGTGRDDGPWKKRSGGKSRAEAQMRKDVEGGGKKKSSLADKLKGVEVVKEKVDRTGKKEIVEVYDYVSEKGKLLHQTLRFEPKEFRQRRPARAGEDGEWVWSLKDSRVVPYRLPEILAAGPEVPIFLVEGEKDVDCLRELSVEGLPVVVTTFPMGAGKWRDEYARFFRGRWVVIIPDYDVPGLEGAEKVARELFEVANRVGILELEKLWRRAKPGDDVADWRSWCAECGITIQVQSAGLMKAAESAGHAGLDFYEEIIADSGRGLKVMQDRLARNLVKCENLMYCGDHFWRWNGGEGIWDKLREKTWFSRKVRRKVVEAGGESALTSSLVSSVEALARSERVKFPEELNGYPEGCFPVANGLLELETGRLFPSRAGHFTTTQIPHVYDPAAACPEWLKWLEDRQEDEETRNQIQEIFGYCLGTSVNFHSFFFFYGDGGTGKSTCVDVLEWLIGSENKVSLELTELDNPFTRSQLVGKSLYLAKELTTRSFKHIGLIKAIVSGDPVSVDVKYGQGFDFRPRGRLVMESNVLACTPDSSGGFERRFIQVNFDKPIDRKKMEYGFQERFKAEMSGILNWALEGYRRLMARGRFEHTQKSQAATDDLLKHRAGVSMFLKSGMLREVEDPTGELGVRMERIYGLYNEWCETEAVVPFHKDKGTFAREVFTQKKDWKMRSKRKWFPGEIRDTFILGIQEGAGGGEVPEWVDDGEV